MIDATFARAGPAPSTPLLFWSSAQAVCTSRYLVTVPQRSVSIGIQDPHARPSFPQLVQLRVEASVHHRAQGLVGGFGGAPNGALSSSRLLKKSVAFADEP